MNSKSMKMALSAGALTAACATVSAQPVIDGVLDSLYGSPVATQTASVIDSRPEPPIEVCIQSDQSNQGGKGAYLSGGTASAPNESDPALVTKGLEISFKIADLPGSGIGGVIRMAGFASVGAGQISNQVIGGPGTDFGDMLEPRTLDFSDNVMFPGNQFVTISTTPSATPAVVDGNRDTSPAEAAAYGANLQALTIGSNLNSNTQAPADRREANGTEIDGVYAYVYDNGTPADLTDDILNVFIAGNLRSNFTWLHMFFDLAIGGQSTLLRQNDGISFNALIRMGENLDGTNTESPGVVGPGLTFDAGFTADYWAKFNFGSAPNYDTFLDSATILSGVAGVGAFSGPVPLPAAPGTPISATIAGGTSPDAAVFDFDNANSPAGTAPNNGGVGGRIILPGGGTQADLSDPATVLTGTEYAITLEGLGLDPLALPPSITMAGFLLGSGWDFMSNNAIGGLTQPMNLDPPNLGSPAKDVDFNQWDGNQFVTIPIPSVVPPAPAGAAVDGAINSSVGEQTAYGAALYVNTTNGAGFGDSVLDPLAPPIADFPGPRRSIGSEIDAVYAFVALDPANANKPTLFVTLTGNLHDFNKHLLFFDSVPGGQNEIRGDNGTDPNINFNGGLGGPNGFVFDTGFEADLAVAYEAGYDDVAGNARHFGNIIQLKTNGGGFGGGFGGDRLNDIPICGVVTPRVGLGNNTLTPLNEGPPDFFDRSVRANGTELDALYMHVNPAFSTLSVFLAGNLQDNFTTILLFFDTIPGGQSTLIFDDLPPTDPAYTGNPPIKSSLLNRMGGPVLDAMGAVLNEGFTFDTGFAPDFVFQFNYGNFAPFVPPPPGVPIENDGAATIFGDWAKLRVAGSPPGPSPINEFRFLGSVNNDSFFASTIFTGGDQLETISAAGIHNANLGGVGGGDNFFDTDGTETDPATVDTGIEVAIDIADLEWNGSSQIRVMAMVISGDGSNVFNQFLPNACTNDPGEPRDVNMNRFPGDQFAIFPPPIPAPAPTICAAPVCCLGNAEKIPNNTIDFDDVIAVLGNWQNPLADPNGTSPGDANCDGLINFDDVIIVLANSNLVCP